MGKITSGLWSMVGVPLLAVTIGAFLGWRIHDWRDGAQQTKAAIQAVKVVQHDGAVITKTAVQNATAQTRIEYVTRTRIERIPLYVTAEADRDCRIPAGFVRVWNEASVDADPAAAARPGPDDSAPSGVVLSQVATAHAVDAATYQSVAARLIALQAWVSGTSGAPIAKPTPPDAGTSPPG